MTDHLIDFIRGATMMAEIGIAFFFLKYFKQSDERLFLYFSAAFFVLSISQVVVVFFGDSGEFAPYAYYGRMIAFILLTFAIVEKNLQKDNRDSSDK